MPITCCTSFSNNVILASWSQLAGRRPTLLEGFGGPLGGHGAISDVLEYRGAFGPLWGRAGAPSGPP